MNIKRNLIVLSLGNVLVMNLLLLLFVVLTSSCSNTPNTDPYKEVSNSLPERYEVRVHVIDSCQYISIYYKSGGLISISHKGNCKNH